MDGRSRWADNIILERFWRIYKHEFPHGSPAEAADLASRRGVSELASQNAEP